MTPTISLFSRDTIASLEGARSEASAGVAAGVPGARALLSACELAFAGVSASDAGESERAGALIREAVAGTSDIRLLFLAFQFFFRSGDMREAERFARIRLEMCTSGGADEARACTNLGLVHQMRGQLDEAERWQQRAIAIDRASGDERSLARDLGNLALVPEARGELDAAERLYCEALEIAERVGAIDIVASKLANLGDIALARGQRAEARALWARALGCYREVGDAKGEAHCAALLAQHAASR